MTNLKQAQTKARAHREEVVRRHRDTCLSLGEYCAAMETVQSLTSSMFQPGLGGNLAEENALRKLLFSEPPMRSLLLSGEYEMWMGWGWSQTCEVIPIRRKYVEVNSK